MAKPVKYSTSPKQDNHDAVAVPLAGDDWGHKLPNAPTQFIFGYGSLIDTASREATAGKPTPAIPVRISAAFGYVRAWVERCRCGFTALGLRRPQPGECRYD